MTFEALAWRRSVWKNTNVYLVKQSNWPGLHGKVQDCGLPARGSARLLIASDALGGLTTDTFFTAHSCVQS